MQLIPLPTKLNAPLLKHACLLGDTREGHIKACESVASSSLISCISDRILWKDDDNMVSLGSPFQDAVELDEIRPPYDYNGSMDCDDAYFAEHSMRCATLLYQCNANTHTTSVLKCCLTTLNCSSVLCNLFDISNSVQPDKCEHGLSFSTCLNCKEKYKKSKKAVLYWILDSGAFMHFTGEKSNFITFEEFPIKLPIQTANGMTYITGKSSIVFSHKGRQDESLNMTIDTVFYCANLMCCLLSLGAFLRDGFSVSGNRNLIALNTRDSKDFMLFRPRVSENTIFIL